MQRFLHCQICDNKLFNLQDGILCGLTNKKPAFDQTCDKISLDKMLEDKTKEINIEYHLARRNFRQLLLKVIINIIVGTAFVIIGYLLWKEVLSHGVIASLPIFIVGIGIYIYGKEYNRFTKHQSELALTNEKKERFDALLSLYHYTYEIDFDITEIHGSLDIQTQLKFYKF